MRFVAVFLAVAAVSAQPVQFDYNPRTPIEWKLAGVQMRGSVRVEDVSFRGQAGGRIEAYLVKPPGRGKTAAALFVHWYESESPTSNRTQFLDEAVELAQHGLTALLVSTPWSDPQWYPKRDVSKDYENSVAEVKELRWAMHLLLKQDRVDAQRVALVGHDFGAMYGLLAVSAGPKPAAVALQAFAPSFSDWFLYNQRALSAEGKQAVIDRLAPLDPVKYLPVLANTPVLMQFAREDFYVPRDRAEALYAAARDPRKILWYEAGHGLNSQASRDRIAWLLAVLRLK